MNRRQALQNGGWMAAGLLTGAFPRPSPGALPNPRAADRVRLGASGVEVSRLAIGTGTNGYGGSSNQSRKLGLRGLADLLVAGFEQGVTFWDSADQYGTHPHLRSALARVPREKVALLTKTRAASESEMRADLDRFRRELSTDYIDILLLHAMMAPDWPERRKGAMAVLEEARQKGIVKTHGISCHSLEALKTAARTPWAQVNLVRTNPAGVNMDAAPEAVIPVLRQMKAAGQGILGMKILGQGDLRNRVDECLRFAVGLDALDAFTVGIESRAELADLIKRIPAAVARG